MNRLLIEHHTDLLARKIDTIARELYREDALLLNGMVGYGYIRVSGYIEMVHKTLLGDYAIASCSESVARFVVGKLSRIANLNCAKCIDLVGSFSLDWQSSLERRSEMGEGGKWKSALDGVCRIRNSLAHGGNQTMNVAQFLQDRASAKEYFDYLELLIRGGE